MNGCPASLKGSRAAVLASALVLLALCPAHAQPIKVVHFEFQPLDSAIIQALLKATGRKGETRIYPWKRAYKIALSEENVLIGPLLRTPAREPLFKWLDPPVSVVSMNLYRLKGRRDIVLSRLEDLSPYRVGVVSGYASTQYLIDRGFRENLNFVHSEELNLRKLLAGRVDLVIMSNLALLNKRDRSGPISDRVETAYVVYQQDNCFAFSKKTSEAVFGQFCEALRGMQRKGVLERLKRKHRM